MDREKFYESLIAIIGQAMFSDHHYSNEPGMNIVDAIIKMADGINRLADATDRLGVGTVGGDRIAPTNMGAIELLALEVKNLGTTLEVALENLNDTITNKQ